LDHETPRLYADRTAGGDRDPRGLDRAAVAGRAGGAGGGAAVPVRQFGIAVQNYADTNGALAPTSCSGPNDFSMKSRLLPFIEQGANYNAINMLWISSDPPNYTSHAMQISVFLCPSDGNIPAVTKTSPSVPGQTLVLGQQFPAWSFPPHRSLVFISSFVNLSGIMPP
jgi:hypothetical protein